MKILDHTVVSSAPIKILLENGARLNIQLVVVRVTDTGEISPEGVPLYQIQMQQIVDFIPPEDKIDPSKLKSGV